MMSALDHRDNWLAAEFALGVLAGRTLRFAQARFEADMAFRHEVEMWQEQFSPLLDRVSPETPSSAVWQNIEKRLFVPHLLVSKPGLWNSLGLWRGLSLAAGSLAAVAVAALLYLPGTGLLVRPDAVQPLVATLTETGQAPAFVARFDPESGRLVIRVSARGSRRDDTVPELWLIPGDGVPRSLGVLDATGAGDVQVDRTIQDLISAGAALAVSLEPVGGSPTGAPTGPVIASGALQPL